MHEFAPEIELVWSREVVYFLELIISFPVDVAAADFVEIEMIYLCVILYHIKHDWVEKIYSLKSEWIISTMDHPCEFIEPIFPHENILEIPFALSSDLDE